MGQSLSTNNRHHSAGRGQKCRSWLTGSAGLFLLLLAVGCGRMEGVPVSAQGEVQAPDQKLKPNGAAEFDRLGVSLDLERPLMVLGALGSSLPTSEGGAAHVYFESDGTWSHEAMLNEEATAQSGYGHAVATDGERVVVTAPLDSTVQFRAGAAFVYVRDGDEWLLEESLLPAGAKEGSRFGVAADIHHGRLAVSARGEEQTVYLFETVDGEWQEVAQLPAPAHDPLMQFGWAVDLDDRWLAISEMSEDQSVVGSVYLYRHEGQEWHLAERLVGAADADRFGASLALNGDRLLVGSPSITSEPAVHAFSLAQGDWVPDGQLEAPNDDAAHFGAAVDLEGEVAVVGAPGAASNVGSGTGSAYLFELDRGGFDVASGDWVHRMTFEALTPRAEDSFGVDVAIDGDLVLVGATGDDEVARDSGAVYLFRGFEASDDTQR